jgi:hypothetical protein
LKDIWFYRGHPSARARVQCLTEWGGTPPLIFIYLFLREGSLPHGRDGKAR